MTKWTVDNCYECPFHKSGCYEAGDVDHYCEHPDHPDVANRKVLNAYGPIEPPDDCPLRQGPVTVELDPALSKGTS